MSQREEDKDGSSKESEKFSLKLNNQFTLSKLRTAQFKPLQTSGSNVLESDSSIVSLKED
jgi:hypothetical protein